MKLSQYPINTLKETPAEAEIVSHQLMLRAGLIRRLSSGLYTWMPIGLRTLRKAEAIVREEMNRAGALELIMPVVQPAELWQETGRWEAFGPLMLHFKDRHERQFTVGPTHEEVITDIARRDLKSYRQLPVNFYQIQTKFRDEVRPRFGVMRAREFIMKDAYSFHIDEASLREGYRKMYDAYTRIFSRMELRFRAVKADAGAIGGDVSQEFHVLADSGEDAIAVSDSGDYAANVELAEALAPTGTRAAPTQPLTKTHTPGKARCEDVANFLGVPLERSLKSIVLAANPTAKGEAPRIYMLLLRGDHELNEVKVSKLPGLNKGFRFATEAEIKEYFGTEPGYLGPIRTLKPVTLIADRTVALMSDFVCGANEKDYHFTGVNWGRDLPEPQAVEDLRKVVEGDPSPGGSGKLGLIRGIEVGHVFQLGLKYSLAMKAEVLDENGKSMPLHMGCYGIGVTRVVAAAIEQNHDERGIIWPDPLAPFHVVLVPINLQKSPRVREVSDRLYEQLQEAGIEVLYDDRDARPGVKFADAELLGIPHRVVVGDRGIDAGKLEYRQRRDTESQEFALDDALAFIRARVGR
jgi:prolyl-tRNA synthetase